MVRNMNDYMKLRDSLKNCKKRASGTCECNNEVVCAKRIIEKYVHGDKDKLLKLKSQGRNLDSKHSSSEIMSEAAMAISILTMFITVVLDFGDIDADKITLLFGFILMTVAIFLLVMPVKNSLQRLSIWNDYMNVAIEELEQEYNKKK